MYPGKRYPKTPPGAFFGSNKKKKNDKKTVLLPKDDTKVGRENKLNARDEGENGMAVAGRPRPAPAVVNRGDLLSSDACLSPINREIQLQSKNSSNKIAVFEKYRLQKEKQKMNREVELFGHGPGINAGLPSSSSSALAGSKSKRVGPPRRVCNTQQEEQGRKSTCAKNVDGAPTVSKRQDRSLSSKSVFLSSHAMIQQESASASSGDAKQQPFSRFSSVNSENKKNTEKSGKLAKNNPGFTPPSSSAKRNKKSGPAATSSSAQRNGVANHGSSSASTGKNSGAGNSKQKIRFSPIKAAASSSGAVRKTPWSSNTGALFEINKKKKNDKKTVLLPPNKRLPTKKRSHNNYPANNDKKTVLLPKDDTKVGSTSKKQNYHSLATTSAVNPASSSSAAATFPPEQQWRLARHLCPPPSAFAPLPSAFSTFWLRDERPRSSISVSSSSVEVLDPECEGGSRPVSDGEENVEQAGRGTTPAPPAAVLFTEGKKTPDVLSTSECGLSKRGRPVLLQEPAYTPAPEELGENEENTVEFVKK
ncbi:unnamed protein product, partial [Amoebophrya sp. A120]|eukprot:GSA120T00025095001.1